MSRKAFIMSWMAKGVPGGMDHGRIEGIRNTFPEVRLGSLAQWIGKAFCASCFPLMGCAQVRRRLAPERQHIVMDSSEFTHFVSTYEHKWPEMFAGAPPAQAKL